MCVCYLDILREFNPLLTGYATGKGDENSAQSFLNQAVPGAKAEWVASPLVNQLPK